MTLGETMVRSHVAGVLGYDALQQGSYELANRAEHPSQSQPDPI